MTFIGKIKMSTYLNQYGIQVIIYYLQLDIFCYHSFSVKINGQYQIVNILVDFIVLSFYKVGNKKKKVKVFEKF